MRLPPRVQAGAAFASRHALASIVALGAILRFAALGEQSFWLDEEATLNVIGSDGAAEILKAVVAGESNPPVYYLSAAGWAEVFGSSEIGLRSLSALAGTATIPLVYAAAHVLATRRVGLIAAALSATAPVLIWYSQESRSYALLVLLVAVAFLCFVKALDDRGHRWLFGWALASAVALSTHYFAFALIVPQAVWLFARRRGSPLDTALAAGVVAAIGVALLPLVATQRGRGDWIDNYDLADRLLQVPEHFLVGFNAPWDWLPLAVLAATGALALYGAARMGWTERLAVPWSVFVGGLAMLLLAVVAGDDYIVSRNLLGLFVPFAIGFAAVLGSSRTKRVGTPAAVALCAAGAALTIWTAATPEAQRPDYESLAEELGPSADRRLIVSQTGFSSPLAHYLEGVGPSTDPDPSASELVVVQPRVTESYAVGPCWWIWTCGGVDLDPAPRFEPPPGFELERSGSTPAFEFSVYASPKPRTIERPTEFVTPRVFVQEPAEIIGRD
jgi:mannosyltransferase